MIICYTFLFYRTSILEYILHARTHARTHTHTHTFNGPLSGTTQVSQYQKGKTNLDFIETRHSEWQRHQLGRMQVCTSLQTDNHASTPPLSFLQAACPSCRPTNSITALEAIHLTITESLAAIRCSLTALLRYYSLSSRPTLPECSHVNSQTPVFLRRCLLPRVGKDLCSVVSDPIQWL